MSRPCDYGRCDVEGCADVNCADDMKDLITKEIEKYSGHCINKEFTELKVYAPDGSLDHTYHPEKKLSRPLRRASIRMYLNSLGVE